MTELNAYLEIAGHANGATADLRRFADCIDALRHSRIHGQPVRYVHVEERAETPCNVPHFGHSNRCEAVGQCEDVLPWGVNRYFSIRAILTDGEIGSEAFGTYQLTPYGRLEICGVGVLGLKDRFDLEQIRRITERELIEA